MTPEERWRKVIKREKPYRIPMFYQATPKATVKLLKYLNEITRNPQADVYTILFQNNEP